MSRLSDKEECDEDASRAAAGRRQVGEPDVRRPAGEHRQLRGAARRQPGRRLLRGDVRRLHGVHGEMGLEMAFNVLLGDEGMNPVDLQAAHIVYAHGNQKNVQYHGGVNRNFQTVNLLNAGPAPPQRRRRRRRRRRSRRARRGRDRLHLRGDCVARAARRRRRRAATSPSATWTRWRWRSRTGTRQARGQERLLRRQAGGEHDDVRRRLPERRQGRQEDQ